MDLKELKEILQILEEKDVAEFELEEEGMKLRIRKASPASANHATGLSAPLVATFVPSVGAASGPTAVPAPAAAGPTSVEPADAGLTIVKSPIVGTFYRTPDPSAPPFVEVGDRIRVGQVLCIIEAMKLMNEIEAEVAGEVVKVHRETGQPVQYGDPLFTVRAD